MTCCFAYKGHCGGQLVPIVFANDDEKEVCEIHGRMLQMAGVAMEMEK